MAIDGETKDSSCFCGGLQRCLIMEMVGYWSVKVGNLVVDNESDGCTG